MKWIIHQHTLAGIEELDILIYKTMIKALKDFKLSYKVNPNHVHVLNNLATEFMK